MDPANPPIDADAVDRVGPGPEYLPTKGGQHHLTLPVAPAAGSIGGHQDPGAIVMRDQRLGSLTEPLDIPGETQVAKPRPRLGHMMRGGK